MLSLSMYEKYSRPPNFIEEKNKKDLRNSLLVETVPASINPSEDNNSPVE